MGITPDVTWSKVYYYITRDMVLLNFMTHNNQIVEYSWLLMEHCVSAIIVGSTTSGKTTLLNSLVALTWPRAVTDW